MAAKHPAFTARVEALGVKYIRVMPEQDDPTSAIGRGWRSTFNTDTREGAEEKLKELGSTWEWLSDGSLKTITKALPAIRQDDGPGRTQTRNFFNSMVAAYTGYVTIRGDNYRLPVYPCNATEINTATYKQSIERIRYALYNLLRFDGVLYYST
jgi:hypothetical protein